MAGMHIAARGSRAGQLVPCKAASPETCGLTNAEHYPDEATYLKTLAESNDALTNPIKKAEVASPEQRLADLQEKAQMETEVELEKMIEKYPRDRAGFLNAMDAVYRRAYARWINEKVDQDHPDLVPTAKQGDFRGGVVDATASAMNEGFKNAHRKRLQESFRKPIENSLGPYWDENHKR